MRKIIVTEYVSLDGVMESPEEWAFQHHDEDVKTLEREGMNGSDALLLGRVTYEIFSAYWPDATAEPYASYMKNAAKYVASTTLTDAPWGPDDHATVINGNFAEEIDDLKHQDGKNIAVIGSAALVRSLLKANLVDELNLLVHPLVLGSGKRLFDHGPTSRLRLVDQRKFQNGVVLLSYQPQQGTH